MKTFPGCKTHRKSRNFQLTSWIIALNLFVDVCSSTLIKMESHIPRDINIYIIVLRAFQELETEEGLELCIHQSMHLCKIPNDVNSYNWLYFQDVGNYVPSDLDDDPVLWSSACVVVDTLAVVDSVDEPTFTQFVFVVS